MGIASIPIIKEDNKLRLDVSLALYNAEAITASIYNFSSKLYIFQSPSKTKENEITIFFESKDGESIDDVKVKEFINDLADQQIRVLTEKEFGHIRDLIVEEAFKPVNK